MVNLELNMIDCLAIESLLCMLDSHINLGSEFKALYGRYLAALSKAGVSSFVVDLHPFAQVLQLLYPVNYLFDQYYR